MAHGERMVITIDQWGRKVTIQSKRTGSKFTLSKDKQTAAVKFPDDELRGPRKRRKVQ